MKLLTVTAIAFSFAISAAHAQDVAAGKTAFNKCMACHSIGENAKNKVGPELNG
jgi:Cytochrome c2